MLTGKYEAFLKSMEGRKKLEEDTKRIKFLLQSGRVSEAHREIERIRIEHELLELPEAPGEEGKKALPPSIQTLRKLEEDTVLRLELAGKKLDEAKIKMKKGEVGEAERLLNEALEKNRELAEAEELLNLISSARVEALELIPEKVGKRLRLLKKDVIRVFRRERNTPDIEINDPHISRDRHLKISIVEDKVIAEDEGSSGGTFVRGQKIKTISLEDGDIIDLARSYRLTVHIYRGGRAGRPTIVRETIPAGMPAGNVREEKGRILGIFLEGDDKNCAVILESLPVSFKPVGIVYEKEGDCAIKVSSGVFLFWNGEEAEILHPGGMIDFRGIRFRIEG